MAPGTKTWLRQSFTGVNGMSFTVSVGIVKGTTPGPTFANVAGQHGMEHMGPIILRDLFEELDPQKLAGTVYVCPCANPLALSYNFEVFPEREQLPGPIKPPPTPYAWQRLCWQAIQHGKIGICIEYSIQFALKEEDRAIGRFAMLNTMKAMGMIEGAPEMPRSIWLIPGPYWEHMTELKATQMGHLHYAVEEYQWLRKGDTIARICDVQTNKVRETIVAPSDCLMLHRTRRPV